MDLSRASQLRLGPEGTGSAGPITFRKVWHPRRVVRPDDSPPTRARVTEAFQGGLGRQRAARAGRLRGEGTCPTSRTADASARLDAPRFGRCLLCCRQGCRSRDPRARNAPRGLGSARAAAGASRGRRVANLPASGSNEPEPSRPSGSIHDALATRRGLPEPRTTLVPPEEGDGRSGSAPAY